MIIHIIIVGALLGAWYSSNETVAIVGINIPTVRVNILRHRLHFFKYKTRIIPSIYLFFSIIYFISTLYFIFFYVFEDSKC